MYLKRKRKRDLQSRRSAQKIIHINLRGMYKKKYLYKNRFCQFIVLTINLIKLSVDVENQLKS